MLDSAPSPTAEPTCAPRIADIPRAAPPAPLEIYRHARFGLIRYELALPRTLDRRGAWMWVFLGSASSLDQRRLDSAVATLRVRLARWRQCAAGGATFDAAIDRELLAMVVGDPRPQNQLLLSDVIQWTGRGHQVTYLDPEQIWMQQASTIHGG